MELYLLHPFRNRWLSLQSDWLLAVRFIPKSHYFVLYNCSISSANEKETQKQNNQSDFKVCLR